MADLVVKIRPLDYQKRIADAFRRKPRRETLKKIACALGVSYEWLEFGIGYFKEGK